MKPKKEQIQRLVNDLKDIRAAIIKINNGLIAFRYSSDARQRLAEANCLLRRVEEVLRGEEYELYDDPEATKDAINTDGMAPDVLLRIRKAIKSTQDALVDVIHRTEEPGGRLGLLGFLMRSALSELIKAEGWIEHSLQPFKNDRISNGQS